MTKDEGNREAERSWCYWVLGAFTGSIDGLKPRLEVTSAGPFVHEVDAATARETFPPFAEGPAVVVRLGYGGTMEIFARYIPKEPGEPI
jgi:hypothetical protein